MESQVSSVTDNDEEADVEEEDLLCSPLPDQLEPPPPQDTDITDNGVTKRRKKGGRCFSLRESLAWNTAFFTEEGVLNQQELSRLSGTGKDDFHPRITHSHGKLPEKSITNFHHYTHPSAPSASLPNKFDSTSPTPKLVNKSLLRAGACPRPSSVSAFQKKLPTTNLKNAPAKESKIPKLSVSKPQQLSSAIPEVVLSKLSSFNQSRTQGDLKKHTFPKGSSSNSKTTGSCISSTSGSSANHLGKNMISEVTTRSKVIPDPVPTVDATASKVVFSLPQNSCYTTGNFTNSTIRTAKPSGLRMPSPSLRYFSQPEASTSLSVKSPRDIQSCNLNKLSISHSRKYGDSCQTGVLKPSHEPAATTTMHDGGVNAMTCLILPSPTTTSHPHINLNTDFKKNVVEVLQASPLLNSEVEIYGDDGADMSNANQHGEEGLGSLKVHAVVDMEDKKAVNSEVPQSEQYKEPFTHVVGQVQHKEDHVPQEKDSRLVEQSSPADSIGDNYVGRGNESKNKNFFELTESTGLTHVISDGELNCELEKASQSSSIRNLQNDYHLENFINACIEKDLKESLNSIPSVDIDKRMLVMHNDCIEVGTDGNTLLAAHKQLTKPILDVVDNVQHEDKHSLPKDNCGPIERGNSFDKSLENISTIQLRCKGLKSYISPKHTKTSDLSRCKISDDEEKSEFENSELPTEDKGATALIPKPSGASCQDGHMLKHKLNAAPFSDEWLAAFEEVGEEILTRKTGAVQNSPPDKSLPEPGPWSPVKRKNIPEMGPFDCTKYTHQAQPQLE